MAATAQGITSAEPRERRLLVAPARVPQRWQKCAPGVSGAAQVPHVAPARAVPQAAQKRPDAEAPQDGQADGAGEGEVTPES
jgi:hypothetical protein